MPNQLHLCGCSLLLWILTSSNLPCLAEETAISDQTAFTERQQKIEKAIDSFKSMGVGVAPFQQMLASAKSLRDEGKVVESDATLEHLNRALEDQQKRFYTNKYQVWRNQQKTLIAEKLGLKKDSPAVRQGVVEAGGGMSKAAHGVLTRGKGDYKPLIYPIAR